MPTQHSSSDGYGQCRSRQCRARIRFVETVNGKMMPLDPTPTPTGNVVIRSAPYGPPYAHVLGKDEQPAEGEPRYTPHWATCPGRARFKGAS